ncbi:CH-like domain in sperm protein, putative [Leishmania shawi]|uniref:CH-like domain in sperm protein n=1 Tax=Leishmania shawi TaxID=5680 RepID=A0ABR3EDM9_9TRYP
MTHASSSEAGSAAARRSSTMGKESASVASSLAAAAPPFSLRTGAVLPRAILAWLQSLQLGSFVKYPKRDLANGYVFAHICAHYWPHVPLHSFENKAGAASKQSNWFVLRKVLRQQGVEVSAAMVDGMMNGADGCAGAFLQQLYTVLTGKHVDIEVVPLEDALPDVPANKVPVYMPASTGGAAARRRYGGGANDPHPSTHVDSRGGFAGRCDKPASLFGAAVAAGSILSDVGGKDGRSAAPVLLSPLPPSLPMPKHTKPTTSQAPALTAEAATADKPLLHVAVRAAGHVSTVLPLQRPAESAAADAAGGPIPSHGSSMAGAWFCMKVRESVPADALEVLMRGNEATATPMSSLPVTLRWLSAYPSGEWDLEGERNVTLGSTGRDGYDAQQAVLRTGVWEAILSAVPELAQILMHHGGHGLDVLVDCLFASVANAQSRLRGGSESDAGGGVPFAFVRNALHFSAVLLATLSDFNVHHAVACFKTYLAASPTFAQAVRGLHWPLAANYAELITAVLPANRRLAAPLLNSLWVTIECVVRDSAAEEATLDADATAGDGESSAAGAENAAQLCLLVLLRALLTSLPPISAGAAACMPLETPMGSHPQASAGGRTATSPARRSASRSGRSTAIAVLTSQDAITNTLVQLAQQRSAAALQHAAMSRTNASSVSVDEAAAAVALAVQVLRMELRPSLMAACVVGRPFFDVYNTLFPLPDNTATPTSTNASSPTLSVLRAQWLRWCLQRWFELGLPSHSPVASADADMSSPSSSHPHQQHQRVSHASLSFGVRDGGDHHTIATTLATAHDVSVDSHEMRALWAGVQTLCRELSSAVGSSDPAEKESRLLAASALAELLPFLPAKYKAEGTDATRTLITVAAKKPGGVVSAAAVASDAADGDGQLSDVAVTSPHADDGGSIFAEDAAEAALRVFVHEATPAQMRSILACTSKSRACAAAQEAEALVDEAPWVVHRYVGPLKPSGFPVENCTLLLVKAALSVLNGGGGRTGNLSSGTGSPSRSVAVEEKDVSFTGNAGGARRLAARAAVVAREGQVEEKIAERVRWLASLLVEGRAGVGGGAPLLFLGRRNGDSGTGRRSTSSVRQDPTVVTSAASKAEVRQWQAVLARCYEDVVLVIQAASLRLRQRGGTGAGGSPAAASVRQGTGNATETAAAAAVAHVSEAVGKELLMLAQKAEGVVCTLWRELAPALASPTASGSKGEAERYFLSGAASPAAPNPTFMGVPLVSFLEGVSQEEVVTAVSWIFSVAGAS